MGLENLILTKENAVEMLLDQNRRYRADLTEADAMERTLKAKVKDLERALNRALRRAEKAEGKLDVRRREMARRTCAASVVMADRSVLVCDKNPAHTGPHRHDNETFYTGTGDS